MKSRDQIGKAGSRDLLEYYITQFGGVDSIGFKCAQRAFIESMAGYAVICFLLNIKVRDLKYQLQPTGSIRMEEGTVGVDGE